MKTILVAFKLSKRKADDNLQLLHTILFGKKAKVMKIYIFFSLQLFCCCNVSFLIIHSIFTLLVFCSKFFMHIGMPILCRLKP